MNEPHLHKNRPNVFWVTSTIFLGHLSLISETQYPRNATNENTLRNFFFSYPYLLLEDLCDYIDVQMIIKAMPNYRSSFGSYREDI